MTVNLNDFEREAECFYKNERYSVRDNGAVLRHPRKNKPLRKYDNHWTFGKPNNNGYLLIVSEVVHRIVACAFLGAPPTTQHIVDHIDTNRQNNRPENLRWLTKLENILNNPITVKKIVHLCGSIEAFLEDPSILKNHINEDRNFGWMRAVTPEEARISWERLGNWADKENDGTSSQGGSLGEWIFKDNQNPSSNIEISEFTNSLTPNAVQNNWKTPSEFPCCPQGGTGNPIETYAANLGIDEVFSRNKYSNSIVSDFATSKDGNSLWIMCKSSDDNAIKPWSLAQVTFDSNLYVHTNLGSFSKKEGAEKQFTLAKGLEWTGGDTFEDFA
ncbi:HNH endonuclease signature motif containing protein [Belliella kenyensis]|uniref:HNH endonuclease signature motif containing protein n=1 Tax=Belliella kenyensis TaxID=1472724 RepID=A0ABV8EM05_9BACT|nr:HNH endonuclease signature motif containing protein [Belliella kenyensis]MCH7400771.1 HNH endonuclease [Belliella kenyensis]MDN3601941.1 HNH endonuclease signature motif containing protein [Belliella kenyensis]